jgi:hypothetical protein
MRDFEPYEQIWEKETKWQGGREILQRAVDGIRGKGLIAEMDSQNPSTVQVKLPLPYVTVETSCALLLPLGMPTELASVFQDRLTLALNVNRIIWVVNVVFRKYEGIRLTPGVISDMNMMFQRFEDLSASLRESTLADIIAHYFGLWPVRGDVSSITKYEIGG